MKISVHFDMALNRKEADPRTYRSVIRMENEETMWAKLAKSLEEISLRYHVDLETVQADFAKVSCNLELLSDFYERKKYNTWTPLFDYALAMGPERDDFYKTIVTTFTPKEIEDRKKYLGEEKL